MMQTQQTLEPETSAWRYVPVPDRPVISEPHIEDYLDHVCAPLIGVLSYEDRQRVREAKRTELETIIQSHIELGCSRQDAIAQTLLASPIPAQRLYPAAQSVTLQRNETESINKNLIKTNRTAFALASVNALIGMPVLLPLSHFFRPIRFEWNVLIAAMAVAPTVAGVVLGWMSSRHAAKSWSKASLLSIPLFILSYLVVANRPWDTGFLRNFHPLGTVLLTHIGVSAIGGWIGTSVGRLSRKELAPPVKRVSSSETNRA